MPCLAKDAVTIARGEVGYLEKASAAGLDSKTANPGSGNYTKYARDLHRAGYYQASKQGYPWCDVFFDWVIWKLCGEDGARANALTFQTGPYGAGCGGSAQYYKQAGRFRTADPRAGDQIFFWDAQKTRVAHTGLVTAVEGGCVYTVEGNTSGASGVVANGGGVFEKRYYLEDDRIYGYGSPDYDEGSGEGYDVNMNTLKKGDKGPQAAALQALLIGYGYDCGRTGADGDFGPATDAALRKYQSRCGLTPDGIAGPKTWAKLLGAA